MVQGVTSGSGSVTIDGVGGALTVTTSSSAFVGRALNDSVRVRTASGTVDATLVGTGDADVETGSSAIRVRGINGGLKALTRSGRVSLQGRPASAWNVSTGSGGVDIAVDPATPFSVQATSSSGSATLAGAEVQGSTSKRNIAGTIGGGGPLVRVESTVAAAPFVLRSPRTGIRRASLPSLVHAIVAIAKRHRLSPLSRQVERCRSILAFKASDGRRAIGVTFV